MGMIGLWSSIAQGEYASGSAEFARAGLAFSVLLIGGLLLAIALTWNAPNAVNIAAMLYAIGAISISFDSVWIHVGNAQRTTFELFAMLALSVLWVGHYPRWLRAGLIAFWISASAYTFWGSYDASYVRETVVAALLHF